MGGKQGHFTFPFSQFLYVLVGAQLIGLSHLYMYIARILPTLQNHSYLDWIRTLCLFYRILLISILWGRPLLLFLCLDSLFSLCYDVSSSHASLFVSIYICQGMIYRSYRPMFHPVHCSILPHFLYIHLLFLSHDGEIPCLLPVIHYFQMIVLFCRLRLDDSDNLVVLQIHFRIPTGLAIFTGSYNLRYI